MAILMCRPDHYGVEYEINPWMHVETEVDGSMALAQWQALYNAYSLLGERVEVVDQQPGLPTWCSPRTLRWCAVARRC